MGNSGVYGAKRWTRESGDIAGQNDALRQMGNSTDTDTWAIYPNVTMHNNLTVNGSFTFGDAATDSLTITGYIDLNATTTGTTAGLDISQAGTGKSLRVDQNNTADPGLAFEIDDEATGATNEVVKIASVRTGTIVNIVAEADAATIMTLQGSAAASTSRGLFLNMDNTAGTDSVFQIDDEGTAAKTVVQVASLSTGTLGLFDAEGNAAQVVEIQSAGTGKGLLMDLNATGDSGIGLEIDDEATGATSEVIKVASAKTGTLINVIAEGDAATIMTLQGSAAGSSSRGLFLNIDNTAGTDSVLQVDDESTAAKTVVQVASASTGTLGLFDAEGNAAQVVEVQSAGTGKGLLLDLNATGDSGIGFEIDDEATGNTSEVVKIASAKTGTIVNVVAEADAATIMTLLANAAASTSRGLFVDINNTAGTDSAIQVDDEGTAAKVVVQVASLSTGTLGLFDAEGNAAQVVEIQSAGTGKGLLMDLNATADSGIGLEIDDESTGNTNQAVLVASKRTGTVAAINVEGAAVNGLEIDVADGGTGGGLYVDHNETDGNAVGIQIDVASTGASAFAFKFTGIATNTGILQTDAVGTDVAIDNTTAVIRVQGGSTTYYIPLLSTKT